MLKTFNRNSELDAIKLIEPCVFLADFNVDYSIKKGSYWHKAEWRSENKPSVCWKFKDNKWLFKDFGSNKAGSIIDFYMSLFGVDYQTAVKDLRNKYLLNSSVEHRKKITFISSLPAVSNSNYTIKKKQQVINNRALLEYLKSRKIDKIPDFVGEIYWQANGKNYFALYIEDRAGNYICRNKFMKINLKKGHQKLTYSCFSYGQDNLIVCEGIFDVLTAYQVGGRGFDYISLNSCVNAENLLSDAILDNYKGKVYVALDNDDTGQNTALKIVNYLRSRGKQFKVLEFQKDFNEDYVLGVFDDRRCFA